jgi:hypothetical protein
MVLYNEKGTGGVPGGGASGDCRPARPPGRPMSTTTRTLDLGPYLPIWTLGANTKFDLEFEIHC